MENVGGMRKSSHLETYISEAFKVFERTTKIEGGIFIMAVKNLLKNKIVTMVLILALVLTTMGTVSFLNPTVAQAYTYPFVRSYYISDLSASGMQQLGKNANSNNYTGKIILMFGAPQKQSGVYGAYSYGTNGTFQSVSTIATAVSNFITGYNSNSSHTNNIGIAVGTSNQDYRGKGWQLDPANDDYTKHGDAWAKAVHGISTAGKVTSVDTAMDAELNWNTVTNTKNWVNAINNSQTYVLMYDFGDNAGSYDRVTSDDPYAAYTNDRANGWWTSDVYDISYGISCCYAMPQIYFDGTTPHTYTKYAHMNNQWYHVAYYAYYTLQRSMSFAGLISQDGLLWYYNGNPTATLTADAAYNSLKNELAKDTKTTQSSFNYPVIMQ